MRRLVLEQAARVEDYPRLADRLDRSKFVTRLTQLIKNYEYEIYNNLVCLPSKT